MRKWSVVLGFLEAILFWIRITYMDVTFKKGIISKVVGYKS